MSLLLSFLASNWKSIAVGLLLLAVAGYIGVLKHEVQSAKDDLATEKAHSTALAAQLKDYQTTVDAYIAASDAARQRAAAAMKKAQQLQEQNAWLESLLHQPTPAGKGCKEAIAESRGILK